ncbi:MAG: hypothetical protein GY871_12075, partial [Actinomycetales bacterium]|nr:hypothetical protein [Actinomycetales bacterium]
MAQTFNGATCTFTIDGGESDDTVLKFNIRDFSESGNDRAAIDVTTAASTRRQVLYGYAEPSEFTFECVYDQDADQVAGDSEAINRATLEALLDDQPGVLAITFEDDGTAGADSFGGNRNAVVKGFTFQGELDGVISYSITFGIIH